MTNIITMSPALQSEVGTTVDLPDNWFDAIEVGLRERVREFRFGSCVTNAPTAYNGAANVR